MITHGVKELTGTKVTISISYISAQILEFFAVQGLCKVQRVHKDLNIMLLWPPMRKVLCVHELLPSTLRNFSTLPLQ